MPRLLRILVRMAWRNGHASAFAARHFPETLVVSPEGHQTSTVRLPLWRRVLNNVQRQLMVAAGQTMVRPALYHCLWLWLAGGTGRRDAAGAGPVRGLIIIGTKGLPWVPLVATGFGLW